MGIGDWGLGIGDWGLGVGGGGGAHPPTPNPQPQSSIPQINFLFFLIKSILFTLNYII